MISGPASVLYGQANPGGIVNMVSKKPTDEPLCEAEVSIGTDGYLSGGFDISDRFDDAFGYRIAATGLTRDLQEDYAKQSSFAIAPSVTWSPDEGTSLTLLGGYQNEPDAGFRNFLDAAGTVEPIPGFGFVSPELFVSDPDFERAERQQAWIGYEFKHEINDNLTFRQNARYHRTDWLHHTLVYGWLSADPVTGNNTILNRSARGGTDDWSQFAVDNQLEAKFSTGPAEHTLLAGIDYQYRKRDYQWGSASAPTYLSPAIADVAEAIAAGKPTDDFWTMVERKGTPLFEDGEEGRKIVTFLGRGAQRNIRLFGAPSGDHEELRQLAGSDIWFKSFDVPDGTRLSYQLAFDVPDVPGTARDRPIAILATAKADPLNRHPWPAEALDAYNQDSVLELAGASPQPWIADRGNPAGTLKTLSIESARLGNRRYITIYRPPGFDPARKDTILLFVFDADQYLERVRRCRVCSTT